MGEILSLLVSITGLVITLFLEWPRIKARFKQNRSSFEQSQQATNGDSAIDSSNSSATATQTQTASSTASLTKPIPKDTSNTSAARDTNIFKTLFALVIALQYGLIFGSIFIPLKNEALVGAAAIIFWLLSIFWALRYFRYKVWKFLFKLFGFGLVLYLVTVMLVIPGNQMIN